MSTIKPPKITIVTVTYNAESFLEDTIQSVIKQDYPNIEYIIIDGASSDNTLNIIKHYEAEITTWVSEPDKGIYDAMNKAIDIASGEWINFMNAGDTFIHSSILTKVSKILVTTQADLISGAINRVDHQGNKEYYPSKGLKDAFNGMFCCHQALFTKTTLMKQYKFDLTYKIGADYAFVMRCYQEGYHFEFLEEPIATFLLGGYAQSNPIQGAIEDLSIQINYLKNHHEIYQSRAYANLVRHNQHNLNYTYARLTNQLFENINQLQLESKSFVLYGFGTIARLVLSHIAHMPTHIIDSNHTKIEDSKYTIEGLETLHTLDPNSYVLITALGREKEIIQTLIDTYNVDESKILMLNLQL